MIYFSGVNLMPRLVKMCTRFFNMTKGGMKILRGVTPKIFRHPKGGL